MFATPDGILRGEKHKLLNAIHDFPEALVIYSRFPEN